MEYSFGTWVKRRRKALDLTQQKLAQRVGCSLSAIFKIESDERRPSRQIADLLAEHLEIPADQRDQFLKVARQEKSVETLWELPAAEEPLSHPTHHLPIPNPVIGREIELEEITRLLRDPQCRLLTLTGQGGIGKTHLALHTAVSQGKSSSQRIAFVNLTPVTGREEAVTAIADALGIVLYSASDRARQLISYLHDKEVLLILDNFEHLAADAASTGLVSDILLETHNVKVITTSRQPLNLQAEWVFEVQGLPVPKSDQNPEIETSSAMKLFVQRAGQSNVNFKPDTNDLLAIARICELVEGLPLGIELAATWVRTLSCAEIAKEIQRSMDFLATSVRDLPERHRSIRATIEHSWQLLTAEEQTSLSQLSIFRGGFNRQAAQDLAGASLTVIFSLVSKSLLRREEAGRFDMHDLIRQFALDRLKSDERHFEIIQRKYTQHFSTWLFERGAALKGSERPIVVKELIAEIANLRQVWHWAASHQQYEELSEASDTLFWLYESRSNCREGVPLYGEAVEILQQDMKKLIPAEKEPCQLALGQALSYKGYFLFRQGKHPQAKDALQSSLHMLEPMAESGEFEAQMALSNTQIFLGTVTSIMGDFSNGDLLLQQGLAAKKKLNDPWGAAFCLRQIGLSAQYKGDYDKAKQALEESLSISREMGNTWSIAASLNQLGYISYFHGKYEQARRYLLEGLELSRELGDRASIAVALDGLGFLCTAQGQFKEARQLLEESIDLWTEIGEQGSLAHTLNHMGNTMLGMEDSANARKFFLKALRVATDARIIPVMLDSLIGEAEIRILENNFESAMQILAAVISNESISQNAKDKVEELTARIEEKLSKQQMMEIQARSHQRDINEFALELL